MKTAKYIKTNIALQPKEPELRNLIGFENFPGNNVPNFKISCVTIRKPHVLAAESHTHDYDQFLYFFSSDAENMVDLNGEVELTLSDDGKTMEKHAITTATSVFIPKGMYHCPLVFTKVEKPILHLNVFFSEDYKRL